MNRQKPDQMNPLRTNPLRTWGYPCSYFPYFSTYSTSCKVSSDHVGYSLISWISGIALDIEGIASGIATGTRKCVISGYVSSDTKFWQAPCCNSTPGQWLWRSVRDRTRMLFQHISTRSLSKTTSSPSPSLSASSPSSRTWCVMNLFLAYFIDQHAPIYQHCLM